MTKRLCTFFMTYSVYTQKPSDSQLNQSHKEHKQKLNEKNSKVKTNDYKKSENRPRISLLQHDWAITEPFSLTVLQIQPQTKNV